MPNAAPSYHGTLVASTVTEIDVAGAGAITITNVDGADKISYTTDGQTPVVAGTGGVGYVLPAAVSSETEIVSSESTTKVKLISAGTPMYAVRISPVPTEVVGD